MEIKTSQRFESHLVENRQVRIFLSSTFSDMQEERDALIQTFEMLKIEAAQRNVSLSVVDLRWGVTEEEAKSGKVISACLNEIENSHPFFIGFLGSNYGTAPDLSELEKNPELKERYDWIEKAISDGMSITEMEIQYGVLCNNDDIDAAFFFKKSNQPDNNKRLTTLKEEVRKKYDPNYQNDYATPTELCEKVAVEVRNIIDKHFPEKDFVTPLDRERTVQRAYINSRHSNFYKRQLYFDIIDDFICNDSQHHLVFSGPSGIGKSALLSNWVLENEKNRDFILIYHFVGNSFSDNNCDNILRHICDEIYDLYTIQRDERLNETIEMETQRLVSEVSQKEKKLVIVIDGINQIVSQGSKQEKLLLWLPFARKNVKYIFSTLPDDETMVTFNRRGYMIENIAPLSDIELEEWIPRYLKRVGKRLDDGKGQLRRIITWALSDIIQGNMLALRTLLDELTRFGIYEKLDERIDYYISATSVPDFFDKVLCSLENDYSPKDDLVKHALMLIAVSEHGLSEDEIITIMNCQERPLEWKLFFCAFYNNLVVKNGLITFSHQYVFEAIQHRYHVENIDIVSPYRHEIIDGLKSPNIGHEDAKTSNRLISEFAHQYYNLREWDNLYKVLSDSNAFIFFYQTNQCLLSLYWRKLQDTDKGKYNLSIYLKNVSITADMATFLNNIAVFITLYITDYQLALKYNIKSAEISFKVLGTQHPSTAITYGNIGQVYFKMGEYTKALKYYKKACLIFEDVCGNDYPETATSYDNIGLVHRILGNYKKAIEYHLKALVVFIKIFGKNHPDTATSYNNIGLICGELGEYNKALEYHLEALGIDEELLGNEHPNTATSYGNVGNSYHDLGKYGKAIEYYHKALTIYERILGTEHPETARINDNIGLAYDDQGDNPKALEYHQKAVTIYEKVLGADHPNTARSYNNIGVTYNNQGDYEMALKFYQKALRIWERVLGESHLETNKLYNNIGGVYQNMDDYDNALRYYQKALNTFEKELGVNHPFIAHSYNNIAMVYENQGDYSKALEYCQKALKIKKVALGREHPETAILFYNIGGIYSDLGDSDMAQEYFHEAFVIWNMVLGKEHPNTKMARNAIHQIKLKKSLWNKRIKLGCITLLLFLGGVFYLLYIIM